MAIKPDIQTRTSGLDILKLAIAAVLLVFGVGQFYYYGNHPLVYSGAPHQVATAVRLLVLLAAIGIAVTAARLTGIGASAWRYLMTAWGEVQRVVWPSRQQTIQATVAVIILVVIAGFFMWLIDMAMQFSLGRITGG